MVCRMVVLEVYLVEEEDRRPAGGTALLGACDHLADLSAPGIDGGELLERSLHTRRDDPGQRRLAGAGRSIEDRGVGLARFDRDAERRSLAEQVRLTDELVEVARAHAGCERRILSRDAGAPGLTSGLE